MLLTDFLFSKKKKKGEAWEINNHIFHSQETMKILGSSVTVKSEETEAKVIAFDRPEV